MSSLEISYINTNTSTCSEINYDVPPPSYKPPSIKAAREFRRNILPRRCPDQNQTRTGCRLSEFGQVHHPENNEKLHLYSMISTPAAAFDEFGEGISIYFKTLKILFVVLIVCAFINIIAINQNYRYNPTQAWLDKYLMKHNMTVSTTVKATSVILQGTAYGATRASLQFQRQGVADITVCFILIFFAIIAGYLERRAIEDIDSSLLTTKDYSILVANPPSECTEAEQYRQHFSRFGEVVSISILKKNDSILRCLMRKKMCETKLQRHADWWEHSWQGSSFAPSIQSEIAECDKELRALSSKEYPPWKVFVTFNTQAARDKCLHQTAVGCLPLLMGYKNNSYAMMKEQVLQVKVPMEPSGIIYENSGFNLVRLFLRLCFTYGICFGLLVVNYFVIERLVNNDDTIGLAVFVTLSDTCFPVIVKYLSLRIEHHEYRNSQEKALFLKLCFLRCLNSAVLIYMTSYFNTKTDQVLSQAFLNKIVGILGASAVVNPVLQVLHIPTLLGQYILAPLLAVTQEDINVFWVGADWTLAERYTDLVKNIFVGLFFLAIVPQALFFTALSMLTTYISDKYSLFYLWTSHTHFDPSLSRIGKYLLLASIFVHVVTTRVFFANWPYGGLFGDDTGGGIQCDFLSCPLSSSMSADQKKLVDFYNNLSIAVIVVVIVVIFVYNADNIAKDLGVCLSDNRNDLEAEEDREGVSEFRDVNTPLYIPTIMVPGLLQPLICADTYGIPPQFYPFQIDHNDDAYLDIARNSRSSPSLMPFLQKLSIVNLENIPVQGVGTLQRMFSTVIFYPPEGSSGNAPSPIRSESWKVKFTICRNHSTSIESQPMATKLSRPYISMESDLSLSDCPSVTGDDVVIKMEGEDVSDLQQFGYQVVSGKKANNEKSDKSDTLLMQAMSMLNEGEEEDNNRASILAPPPPIEHKGDINEDGATDCRVGAMSLHPLIPQHSSKLTLSSNRGARVPNTKASSLDLSTWTIFENRATVHGDHILNLNIPADERAAVQKQSSVKPSTSALLLKNAHSSLISTEAKQSRRRSITRVSSIYKGLGTSIAEGGGGRLPCGWERQVAPDGRPYYVNHIDKTTQWQLPESSTLPDTSIHAKRSKKGRMKARMVDIVLSVPK